MKRGWVVNLVLLVGVIGLGLYAYYKSNEPKEPSYKLSTLTASAAKTIVVESRSEPAYRLERRGDVWFLAAPTQARADQSQVQRILDLLSASSKEKLAAGDLQRFDLATPALKVVIDGQTFAFGGTNPLTQDQYVATGDGVYLVSTYFASLVPKQADRMLTHRLFSDSEVPTGFALNRFSVERKDGKWTLTPQPAQDNERPSQDDLNRWADDWRYASSLATRTWSGKPGHDLVQVKLSDGKTLTLTIVQTAPELVLGRADEKLQFQFSGEMSRRLLQPQPAKDKPGAGAS
ncbi:MAG TPA: DUF4340 domain-containing protein [Burkholderiales bacterium]|nr:DUF4340 domain-containing protein [Burkholderiales bacterium]